MLRWFLLAILLVLTAEAAREGVAAYYLRQNTPEAVQKAMAWDPADPVYPATAANLIQLYSQNPNPNEVVQLYRRALQLSPFDASYCVELAEANESAGKFGLAADYYQQALRLFPNSPEINWKVANFYVRKGRTDPALPLLRNMVSSRVIPNEQVFALITSARLNTPAVIEEVLPADPATVADYLNFQIDHNEAVAASLAWERLMSLPQPFEIARTFHYIDYLIKSHQVDRAKQAWATVVARFPSLVPQPASRKNLVTNGDFKVVPVNGGFDWLNYPVAGASVRYEAGTGPGAEGALRIDFDGSQNLYYQAVAQFVALEPSHKYELSLSERAASITTESGLAVQVVDAYDLSKVFGTTAPVIGTAPWEEKKFSFTAGNGTRLVLVMVTRKRSAKLQGNVAGSVWFTKVRLSPQD